MIHYGDCIEVMATFPDASVDAIVTDPPYALTTIARTLQMRVNPTRKDLGPEKRRMSGGFMGKSWDAPGDGTPQGYQAWCTEWAREAFRVAKPGAYMIAAGGTRTVHRLASAIEDAGWEIRDMLIWAYASGFPKSLNVSAALRKLPPCTCDVPSQAGAVDAGLPAGTVGAGVGTEAGAVPLAGIPADQAARVGSEPRPSTGRRGRKVDTLAVDGTGEFDPVMLWPSEMAGTTEGEQVVEGVGGVNADPEPLRDNVVDDQPIGGSAVNAATVAVKNGVGYDTPAAALVAPSAAPPGGVPVPGVAAPVVGGHAGSGAVDGLRDLAGDDLAAGAAGERVHADDSTTEDRALKCETCGGIRQNRIPEGWGTALKPAFEPWVLARKPLVGSVAVNVTRYGTGALNIGATRIGTDGGHEGAGPGPSQGILGDGLNGERAQPVPGLGRWPSNLLLSDPELFDVANPGVVGSGAATEDGVGYSRFFCIPKADRADREPVLRGQLERTKAGAMSGPETRPDRPTNHPMRENAHPTVKPTDLMRHLVRLVTPPGGTVLDPFLGSGSTAIACELEGFPWIGVEKELEYVKIAEARLNGVQRGLGLDVPAPTRFAGRPDSQIPKARWPKATSAEVFDSFIDKPPEEAA